jgi:hypothetical protein
MLVDSILENLYISGPEEGILLDGDHGRIDYPATWRGPDAPTPVHFDLVGQISLRALFEGRFEGGTSVLEYQLGYGLDPVIQQVQITSPGLSDLTGLDPGKTYYFWARARNIVGWSSWSDRRQVTLYAGARVLVGNTWVRAVPYIRVAGVWKLAKTMVKDAGVWKESKS